MTPPAADVPASDVPADPFPRVDSYPPGPLPGADSLPPAEPVPPPLRRRPSIPSRRRTRSRPPQKGPETGSRHRPRASIRRLSSSLRCSERLRPCLRRRPPPTVDAVYVEPTVLPPVQREVTLEDVQGLPPPVGIQAAAIPPYDPNAPIAPPDPFAVPPVSPAEFGGPYATPGRRSRRPAAVAGRERRRRRCGRPHLRCRRTARDGAEQRRPVRAAVAADRDPASPRGRPGPGRREAAEPSGLRRRIGGRRADRTRSARRALGPAVLAVVRREFVGPQRGDRRRSVHRRA